MINFPMINDPVRAAVSKRCIMLAEKLGAAGAVGPDHGDAGALQGEPDQNSELSERRIVLDKVVAPVNFWDA